MIGKENSVKHDYKNQIIAVNINYKSNYWKLGNTLKIIGRGHLYKLLGKLPTCQD